MNTDEIENNRIAGEFSLILENGTQPEKESILRLFLQCGKTREEVEAIRDSYGIYYPLPAPR